jgi:predicted Zn-dependent protease with MMP-like domain
MPGDPPTLRRILISALAALTVGFGAVSLIGGFSDSFPVRLLQGLAVFGAGAAILGGAVVLVMLHLAGWKDPESEADFDALVERTERLAAEDSWDQIEDHERWVGEAPVDSERERASERGGWHASERTNDPGRSMPSELASDLDSDDEFKALVRAALDELPIEFHRALEHVAIVVSDGGRRQRAYGLYQGDTVARDFFHDRIVIFRDTLTRDFGHDPELLKAQVVRTVRHELAHHLGWDEPGVRGLGL